MLVAYVRERPVSRENRRLWLMADHRLARLGFSQPEFPPLIQDRNNSAWKSVFGGRTGQQPMD